MLGEKLAEFEAKLKVCGILLHPGAGKLQGEFGALGAERGEFRFVSLGFRGARVGGDVVLAGTDGDVELADLQIGGLAHEGHVGVVREGGCVGEPVGGIFPIFLLLIQLGNATRGIDVSRFRFGFCMEFREQVIDHFLASNHAGLLLEGDSLLLVFDKIAIGRFLFFPATALHRGGGGGVLHALDGSHVVRGDLQNPLVEFDCPVRCPVLLLVLGEFVQGFGVLGRTLKNCFEGECSDFVQVRRQCGFAEGLVELRIVGLGFQAFLNGIDGLERVFFNLSLNFQGAERGGGEKRFLSARLCHCGFAGELASGKEVGTALENRLKNLDCVAIVLELHRTHGFQPVCAVELGEVFFCLHSHRRQVS